MKKNFKFFSDEVHISIGGSICNVTSSSDTQIKCTLGINGAGTYSIILLVDSKGLAQNTTQFTYNLAISSLSQTQCKFYF